MPGNHDAYVHVPWETSLGLWQAYMASDEAGAAHVAHSSRFPYVRLRGRIALIGVSTGVPMPPLIAGGRLGQAQLDALSAILTSLGEAGYYRVIMIHHPPLPGQNTKRKALTDARKLQKVLEIHGAELLIHGHNHRDMETTLKTASGTAHVIGVPSASAVDSAHRPSAQYNIYRVETYDGAHRCHMTVRGYNEADSGFMTLREVTVSP